MNQQAQEAQDRAAMLQSFREQERQRDPHAQVAGALTNAELIKKRKELITMLEKSGRSRAWLSILFLIFLIYLTVGAQGRFITDGLISAYNAVIFQADQSVFFQERIDDANSRLADLRATLIKQGKHGEYLLNGLETEKADFIKRYKDQPDLLANALDGLAKRIRSQMDRR